MASPPRARSIRRSRQSCHNTATGAVKSDNIEWISNSRGLPSTFGATQPGTGGNDAGANFIHYENLGYDFLFGDGTGGLSIFSLKDPEHPPRSSVGRRRR